MHYASGVVKIQVSSGAPITLRLKATDDVEARVRAKLCERGFVPASSQIQPTSTVAGDADAGEASSNLLGGSDAPLQSKRARKSIEKYSPSKDWNEHDKRDSHRRSVDKPTTDICSYEQLQADFERLKKEYDGLKAAREECSAMVCSEFDDQSKSDGTERDTSALVDPETLTMVNAIGAPVCSPVDVLAELEHGRKDHARDMLAALQTAFMDVLDEAEDEEADFTDEMCSTCAADEQDGTPDDDGDDQSRLQASAFAVASAQAAAPAAASIDAVDTQSSVLPSHHELPLLSAALQPQQPSALPAQPSLHTEQTRPQPTQNAAARARTQVAEETARVQKGRELLKTVRDVIRAEKVGNLQQAAATLSDVEKGSDPSKALYRKRAQELRKQLFSFGDWKLTAKVLEEFSNRPECKRLLRGTQPQKPEPPSGSARIDEKTAIDVLQAAKQFFTEIMKSVGRRTESDMNAFWAGAAAMLPKDLLISRQGRSAMRILGVVRACVRAMRVVDLPCQHLICVPVTCLDALRSTIV